MYLHSVFFLLIGLEITAGVFFLDSYFSLKTAAFFSIYLLTFLCYFFLFFYYTEKKREEISFLVSAFLEEARSFVLLPEDSYERHISIAHACIRLVNYLEGFEETLYTETPGVRKAPLSQKWSIFWHFFDVFTLKEQLIAAAIEEHIQQIYVTPTDIEIHTSLANTYLLQAGLYENGKKGMESLLFSPFYQKKQEAATTLHKAALQHAIEEYKIIHHYTPDDPWVHIQLAKSYHTLGLHSLEIKEYETLLTLSPQDAETLYRLGVLYFQEGQTAKGLKLYEKLREIHPKKGEKLLSFYGAYREKTAQKPFT